MKILVIDVGGNHIKFLATGQEESRKFDSGTELTAEAMVTGVKVAAGDWEFDVVSIGYPGVVLRGRPISEPKNLGKGWVGFDYEAAFGKPVKIVNDAAMQALGSYEGGRLLFLGLGTGLGSAMIVDGVVEPLEMAHLPYAKATFEDYVGERGLERLGKKRWRKRVNDVTETLIKATEPTDVVIGGGNVKKLKEMPDHARAGDNANAFTGGYRMWTGENSVNADSHPTHGSGKAAASESPAHTDQPDSSAGPSESATSQPEPASAGANA